MKKVSAKELEKVFAKMTDSEFESEITEVLKAVPESTSVRILEKLGSLTWYGAHQLELRCEILSAFMTGLVLGTRLAASREGSVRSTKKARSSRRNGKLGGRPKLSRNS